MLTDRMNISRWYFHFHGMTTDLALPWLQARPNPACRGRILLARSARYQNSSLDHRCLANRSDLLFVGIESEYRAMRTCLPGLEWLQVDDFLQLAEAIAGCRLFIGNQSFPFSLAEALKVPRILELDPMGPNVMPTGGLAHEVLFQKQFEQLVPLCLETTR